jgi:UDP-N-acetylmuramoyl-L-alanyl-D-glutamate--2,6-diaminopimelate ligase
MTLKEYLEGIQYSTGLSEAQLEAAQVSSVTNDSRQVRNGSIFVCIKGGKFDGHQKAGDALAAGAAAVVVERDLGLPRQILVENTRAAYAILCGNHFGNPSRRLKLVGVTGTSGKTTVTFLIKSILQQAGKKVGLMGTIHNEIGELEFPAKHTTPDPYQLHAMLERMAEAGCEYVAMEASSHALDQHRLDGCRFDAGVFTNLSQDHLDYHGTMENYFAAKKKLFSMTKAAVVNLDDPKGEELARELGPGTITFSTSRDDATLTAKNISSTVRGSSFLIVGEQIIQRTRIAMPGRFSVSNAMAAAAACYALGLAPEDIAKGLAACPGVPGRAEVIPTDTGYTVIRDFAHAPEELEQIITTLRPYKGTGRMITLFGCAGDRDRTKREKMGEIVAKYSDLVILTSDNPRTEDEGQIIRDTKPGLDKFKTPYRIIPDRYEAIAWALENAGEGDILLLAGKGHEDYQVLADETIYFDEKVLVQQLLEGKNRV